MWKNKLNYTPGTVFPHSPDVKLIKEIKSKIIELLNRRKRIRYGLFQCFKNGEKCRNKFTCPIGAVKSGNSQSCGCFRKIATVEALSKDFTGKRYCKLFCKTRLPKYKNGDTWYLCICDCGNEKPISSDCWGKTKSCGLCQRESFWNRKDIKEVEFQINKNGEVLNGWYYKNAELWLKITCPEGHKYPKDITWDNYNHGNRCAVCASLYHKTERFIIEKLIRPIVKTVKAQYKIIHKNGSKQYLDAAIENIRVGVEYQGEQHYMIVGWDSGDGKKLKKRKSLDRKKRKWCKDHEWILITIPYYRFKTDEQKEYWKDDIKAAIKYRQAMLKSGKLKFKTEL